ncbi:MAG TPA: DPP IV N-terminal domain-containing protein, partial [Flavisolibacter sp.]|nr:DPP IV N-terminal domain-containing protein [Flavisolibacter sp.]
MRNLRPVVVIFILLLRSTVTLAQPPAGTKWAKDGNSYYAIEHNEIVQYLLPSFKRSTVAGQKELTPDETSQALNVRNFFFSSDQKKILIYTNSKRVWRQDTRGDYWVLDREDKQLYQIGKGKE